MATRSKPLRADAARNRDRLLAAAHDAFAERGLDTPLDEIAQRARVSIGTLYNHFPSRGDLLDALYPQRLGSLERLAEAALADPDPWNGFASFLEGLFELKAEDRGVNDILAEGPPPSPEIEAACRRGLEHVDRIIRRARDSGQLRADFEAADLAALVWAMSRVIRESIDHAPQAWRRFLGFFLDGLRAGSARPLPAAPIRPEAFDRMLGRPAPGTEA